MSQWLAALIGLSGNFCHALGMVLMKKHVGIWSPKARAQPRFRLRTLGWLVGFGLINAHPIFSYFALLGLPPNVVASMIGTSVAFSTILAALLLKESLFPRRVIGIVAMFSAVAFIGLRSGGQTAVVMRHELFAFTLAPLPATLLIVAIKRRATFRAFPTFIAAVAGACGGSMVLALRALQIETGGALRLWLSSPWFWLFYLSGLSSTLLIQLAFRRGDVAQISPADYGMQVLWPTLASHFIFKLRFDPLQSSAIIGIFVALFLIGGRPLSEILDSRRSDAERTG